MTSAFQENAFQNNAFQMNGSGPTGLTGRWRFLKDHFIDGVYIFAGEVRDVSADIWSPTADVEPLDTIATALFYNAGPTLGGCIRTQFQPAFMYPPITYWQQIAANLWVLTGLGTGMTPISKVVDRVEDKAF